MNLNARQVIETAIDDMSREFECSPFNFYSETDMHLRLYILLQKSFTYSISGKDIELVHAEFPTFSKFKTGERHMFERDENKGVTGAYDLVIFDPLDISINGLFIWRPVLGTDSKPRLLAAIELKLCESKGNYKAHIHNDIIKLDESDLLIQNKYMVQFIRNIIQSKSASRHFDELISELVQRIHATDRCRTVKAKYVEIKIDSPPINDWISVEAK